MTWEQFVASDYNEYISDVGQYRFSYNVMIGVQYYNGAYSTLYAVANGTQLNGSDTIITGHTYMAG